MWDYPKSNKADRNERHIYYFLYIIVSVSNPLHAFLGTSGFVGEKINVTSREAESWSGQLQRADGKTNLEMGPRCPTSASNMLFGALYWFRRLEVFVCFVYSNVIYTQQCKYFQLFIVLPRAALQQTTRRKGPAKAGCSWWPPDNAAGCREIRMQNFLCLVLTFLETTLCDISRPRLLTVLSYAQDLNEKLTAEGQHLSLGSAVVICVERDWVCFLYFYSCLLYET